MTFNFYIQSNWKYTIALKGRVRVVTVISTGNLVITLLILLIHPLGGREASVKKKKFINIFLLRKC